MEHPTNVNNLKVFIQQDLKTFYKILDNTTYANKYFEFTNESCIFYDNIFSKGINIYCLNATNTQSFLKVPYDQQQVSIS